MTDPLLVSVEIDGRTTAVGRAYFTRRRGVTTSFRYDDDYLARADAYAVDPALELHTGAHQANGLPGAFADCAPDRWGRNLITRRVQADALRDGRTPPSLGEADFLLGVSDLTRQGALRFRTRDDGPYLHPDLTVPKLVELPRLLHAADTVTRDGGDDMAAVRALLDAGSGSLGGARPKASVRDGDRLFIAKFPHRGDEWDVMAWEKTALDLAQRAGIEVPDRKLVTIDGRSVLLVGRFDRTGERRIGYISAMTLVEGHDGDVLDYTEVAESLQESGAEPSKDLRELWRRIAYSVITHNTDDHLRNHGFLRHEAGGWRLSPAFDINPNPNASEERVTGIGGAHGRGDELAGLMTYADGFGLADSDARLVLAEVEEATRGWRAVAAANGISRTQQARFADTFDGLRGAVRAVASGGAP